MKNLITIIALCFMALAQVNAQQLLTPSYEFSHKKTIYLTLQDGTEIQGTLKFLYRPKGVIESIKVKDGKGVVHKFEAEEVAHVYLAPSGLNKVLKTLDLIDDAQKWNDEKIEQDFLNQGYIYFELAEVRVKKKGQKLLMQLLNPGFSKAVKVYDDPASEETKSIGIGGVALAGGDAKSYYIAKGDNPAFLLRKKDYKKEFKPLWQSCPKLIYAYPKTRWIDLVKHIIAFSECK